MSLCHACYQIHFFSSKFGITYYQVLHLYGNGYFSYYITIRIAESITYENSQYYFTLQKKIYHISARISRSIICYD